jgi:alpha-amylase
MKKIHNILKFVFLFSALVLLNINNLFAQSRDSIKNGTILHCWCWSFKTIEENLPQIAQAGFTAIQTSPINACLEGENGRNGGGKWYYHYQPVDWKIGNYQLGTREDFINMCTKAHSMGIGVIVDVIPNHTTPDKTALSKDFVQSCGGMEKLYHSNSTKSVQSFANRLQSTTYSMGGLPDVNTENPLFQSYFMKFMNDAVSCGANGFRFDTAKHIGLPDDPLDPASEKNNFWPVFTGRESAGGQYLKNASNLFLYGEILQGDNTREKSYSDYINVTASYYGATLRSQIKSDGLSAKHLSNWRNEAGEDKLVTWVESHDTYANAGESAKLTNWQIRKGWAVIAARKGGTPLFFNRPKGAEATQFPGVSKIGDAGNDEFKNSEVSALNNFRVFVKGMDEKLFNADEEKTVLCIERGSKGIVVINAGNSDYKLKCQTSLKDGVYIDKAHGLTFKVKNGVLTGKPGPEKIYVIY